MKNKYTRLKWLAAIILALALYFLVIPLKAAPLNTSSLYILQQEVRGVVTDQAGMPLPGVTVTIKGQNRGTVTDIDGNYSISIEHDDILLFSFMGFQTHEEPVQGRREILIRLEEDISSLGEVQINAGYYSTTKRESTGNISRVTAEEIELQPVISPLQALQGRMAGVEIISGGSHPGMASTIRIRGRNSLREDGNMPLYIVDGVPVNSSPIESNSLLGSSGIDPLNSLNISNIRSIEVLKDADATAIYGSRGANGVVLITTKSGMPGTSGLQAQIYIGAAAVPKRLQLLSTPQYLQIRQQAFLNDDIEPTVGNAYDLTLWAQNRNTDWQKFFFGGTAEVTDVNIATNGGNDQTTFRLGGSYFTQGTVYNADFNYNRATANLNLSHTDRDKKFSLDFSAIYGTDKNILVGDLNLASPAFQLPPNAPPIFNEDGSLHWEEWGTAGLDNPLAGFYNISNTTSKNMLGNLGLRYRLAPGLEIKTTGGYTFYQTNELVKRPSRSYNPSLQEPHNSFHLNSSRKSWIMEPQLTYNIVLDEGIIEMLVGTTFQESTDQIQRFQGEGYVSEGLIGNLAAAKNIVHASSRDTKYKYSAFFGRLAANWQGKYYLNLTGRRDGSSRFGPDNRFANFGAVGAAWIFSEESFIQQSFPFFSFGKIRGSLGTTGNDQIGDYGYLDAYEATKGPGGLYPTQLSNPEYSWEVNNKLEAAIELGFLKDRIHAGLSWYRNRSSNQLVGYPLPATTGFNIIQANLPATVENTGWELELSSKNFQSTNLHWDTSFNITIPKNELISYPSIEQSSYAYTYKVGHPLNISLRYLYDGLDPETGYYTIKDINEDGRFDHQDRVFVQDHGREFYGGINNEIKFRNFSLQFLWEFVKQEGTFSHFNAGSIGAQRVVVLDALQQNSRFQQISQSSQASLAYDYVTNSSFTITDASYFRLKILSLGYNIPEHLLKKFGVKSIKIFGNAQNLITISPYPGMDPEIPYSGSSFTSMRTITGGLQLNY